MNKKSAWAAGVAAVLALGLVAASGIYAEASGQDPKPSVPRYSETCAHGHNGFACDPPQYKVDIADLQERAADLEDRVSQLEKR